MGTTHKTESRLSSLWEAGEASRTTVFELLKIARIEPEPRRVPGSQRPVAFLAGDQLQKMRELIQRLNDGETLSQIRKNYASARAGMPDVDLASITLPEAIAIVVEAWLEAQSVGAATPSESESESDLTLMECCQRWSCNSRNTIKARAEALGVPLRRESSTRTVWPASYVQIGDELSSYLRKPGATLANFAKSSAVEAYANEPDADDGMLLSDWLASAPFNKSTAYKLFAAAGILPSKKLIDGKRCAWLPPSLLQVLDEVTSRVTRGETVNQICAEYERCRSVPARVVA
jgi:hypothetical protein